MTTHQLRLKTKLVSLDKELDWTIMRQRQGREGRNDILRRLLGLPPRPKEKRGPKPSKRKKKK